MEIKVSEYLKNFKDGVADAILYGNQDEKSPRPEGYKQGYDFGITLYSQSLSDGGENGS